MKNKTLIAALLLAGLLVSCSTGFHEKLKKETANIEESKTYLVITDAQVNASRSINPSTTDEQKSEILNNLTSFTLKATKSGTSTVTTLATAQSFTELKSKKISITAGRWYDMTLTAKLNIGTDANPYYINFSDTLDAVTIREGQENKVSFELKTTDNGGLAITMDFSGSADKVVVSLKNADKTALATNRDKTFTTFTQKTEGSEVLNSFTYTLSRADTLENLPSATYYLTFDFYNTAYKDSSDNPIALNTLSYFVNIDSGFETTASLKVDLNEVMTFDVEYEFYDRNTNLPQSGGSLPQGVTVKSGLLPEKLYITKAAEVTLPTMGYTADINGSSVELVFGGWYKDSSFAADKKITGKFDRADSSITTLYALFYIPEIYVTAGAQNGGTGWSEESPLNSFQAALNKIQSLNNPDTEWAIFVEGFVEECITIEDSSSTKKFPAEKLYLIGPGGGGLIGEDNTYNTILTVNTKVPVILQDFTIGVKAPTDNPPATYSVMGQTGLALCVKSNVTLMGNTTIDGQNDNGSDKASSSIYKGAVYVPAGGTLTMQDDATICNWKVCYGGGINVDGGTVIMGGNASITNCDSNYGGAIYMTSGSVTMNNNALIGDTSSDDDGCSATYGGGGVCIKGGTFEMNGSAAISHCKVGGGDSKGGAVYMEGGQFTMNDGSIGNNYAEGTYSARCGGVYLDKGALFTMMDGSIANNIAKVTATTDLSSCNSGGVYLDGNSTDGISTFDMQGGLISGNEIRAKDGIGKGRGVYIYHYFIRDNTYGAAGIFKISGEDTSFAAHSNINHGEDIYLENPSKVTVVGTLKDGAEFTITPSEYRIGRQILENDYEDEDNNDYLYDAYNLFKVTRPDTSILDWHTRSDGTISNYFVADDGHEFVDLELPSGTLWAAYNFGETYLNEKASVPGKRSEWSNFCYGDPNNHVYYEQPWAKEWSIASVSEWQELIDNCYWKASDLLSLSSGNNYYVYYVFKAKSDEDKGNIKKTSYTTANTYDENLDPCLRIVKSAYSSDAYYWPQLFVDSSHENDIYPPSNYTPKPPLIDFTNTSSIIRTDWTNTQSTSNYTYHRLVISKNRTLVVTPNGDDSHTGLNALDSNALQTIQGAINKIQNADYENDCYESNEIDWNIIYFGELTAGLKISGYDSSKVNSLSICSVTGSGANTTKVYWNIDASGTLLYNNSVGDLLLNDGSYINYDENRLNFDSELTSNKIPVGIVYSIDEYKKPVGIIGIKNSGDTDLAWAAESTTGYNTNFEGIQIDRVTTQPAEGTTYFNYNYNSTDYYLTGDLDGSDNWAYICSQDSTAIENAEQNYPAYYYANNYASSVSLSGEYAKGWYVPSASELRTVYENKTVLNKVLSAIEATSGFTATSLVDSNETVYWASSQPKDYATYAWGVDFTDGGVKYYSYKSSPKKVCVVRTANLLPEYSVNFNTNGGSEIPVQKVTSGQKASEPTITRPVANFGGWYSDSSLTTEFDFDTTITDHTILYAKWTWNVSVGDLLLADGTCIAYDATRTSFESELEGKVPVGVIYALDETGAPRGIVGIKHHSTNNKKWARSEAGSGTSTNFTTVVCTPSSEGTANAATITFTGDTDGSDNWNEICKIDTAASESPSTTYPIFELALNYANNTDTNLKNTDFASKWYVPSLAELCYIYRNKDIINNVLTVIGATEGFTATILVDSGENAYYWSSSQSASAAGRAWTINFNGFYVSGDSKTYTRNVCVVRKL
jgi:hypothetical protein